MATRKKITFIGGGSLQWVPVLFRDIAVNPFLQNIRFVLHDLDVVRNAEMADVCRILSRKLKSDVSVETEDTLISAISDADAVILCIATGGLDAMEHDIEIPKRYGIHQPVGDSTGPGGISRTLRNVPVVVELAIAMQKHCPDAWLLNLTNPMNQIVRTVNQVSSIKVIGLCHEFKSFMGTVASLLELDDWERQTSATISGINHFAWVTELSVQGSDGFALLKKHSEESVNLNGKGRGNDVNPSHSLSANQIKFALLDTFGAVPYPGDRHLAEFFPYYLSEKTHYGADFGVQLTSIDDRRYKWIKWYRQRIEEWTSELENNIPSEASNEALAPILAALIGGGPTTIQPATLSNRGQVANLHAGTSVETLAAFSHNMVSPHAGGTLPGAIHAMVQKHALNQDLMVEAAMEGNRTKALQAMMADPLNNNNDVREIGSMLDELLDANAHLLPQFFRKRPVNGVRRLPDLAVV